MADNKGDAVTGLAAPAGSSRGGGPGGAGRALAAEASSGTSAGDAARQLPPDKRLCGDVHMGAPVGQVAMGEPRQAPGSI